MITISHTHADGTLIEGSRKGDGVYEILKGLRDNWRYFRSIGQIGIGQSRDRNAHTYKIDRAAEALRAAGFEVTVEVDESDRRAFADAEAERYERAEARADYHADRAGACEAEAASRWHAERQIRDMIPMGQPILVGHHSEGRHRRDLARADKHAERGLEAVRKGEHHEQRAEAAEHYQASRENVPATLRRIAKLEAEQRGVKRDLTGRVDYVKNDADEYKLKLIKPSGDHLERLTARGADIADQLAYWRAHLTQAETAGVKIWSRTDFQRGDFAQWQGRTWFEVLRVNAKSLTIPALIAGACVPVLRKADTDLTWTDTLSYDKITGRKSTEEIASLLADA